MTQRDLAERGTISADSVRRVEQGGFSPSVDTMRKIAAGLSISLATLFDSFETGSRTDKELMDLIAQRTDSERAMAVRVLQAMFDELDGLHGQPSRRSVTPASSPA